MEFIKLTQPSTRLVFADKNIRAAYEHAMTSLCIFENQDELGKDVQDIAECISNAVDLLTDADIMIKRALDNVDPDSPMNKTYFKSYFTFNDY